MSDTDEFEHGTDPTQGIEPLTAGESGTPWERIGITEDEWNDARAVDPRRDQPRRLEGFLLGDAAEGLTLDENGELVLVPPGADGLGTRTGS